MKHRSPEPWKPCLVSTYAYDADIACNRPLGHGPLSRNERSPGFTWGETDHCATPVPSDGPVYKAVKYTSFRASSEIIND